MGEVSFVAASSARCKEGLRSIRRLWVEQPLITSLAALALATMITQTSLSDVPELIASGAKIGKLCYDLSLAYFGAWTLNVFAVVLPRWRDQGRILRTVGRYLQGASGGALAVLQAMANNTGLPLSQPPTRQEVRALCEAVDPNGDGPSVTFSGGQLKPVTWLTHLHNDADRGSTVPRTPCPRIYVY